MSDSKPMVSFCFLFRWGLYLNEKKYIFIMFYFLFLSLLQLLPLSDATAEILYFILCISIVFLYIFNERFFQSKAQFVCFSVLIFILLLGF